MIGRCSYIHKRQPQVSALMGLRIECMATKQQKETIAYFRRRAPEWEAKARTVSKDRVNVIRQRNEYVLDVIRRRRKTEVALDVGCGTGDLVIEMARMGIRAIGIDFAKEMIRIARENARKNKCRLTDFIHSSIFDFGDTGYDLISVNGFIEYISPEQLRRFLSISFRNLKKGGSIVLSSRNRLFNLFSLNEFTEREIRDGSVNLILLESVALAKGLKPHELRDMKVAPLPRNPQRQKKTGIAVSVRYQYTPGQLIRLLDESGFKPVHLSPIYVHGAAPKFKDRYPAIHAHISNMLQANEEKSPELLPYSSSFMVHAKRI